MESPIEILTISQNQFADRMATTLSQHNTVMIWGEICESTIAPIAAFLLHALYTKVQMVTLVICSGGGIQEDARGLMGIMELCKASGMIIRSYGVGCVCSAAFDLLIACSKGYRFVHETTMLMTHSSSADMRDKDLFTLQERFDDWTLSEYTKINKKTREKFLRTGNWYFPPEDALQYGAIDAIIKNRDKLPDVPILNKIVKRLEEPHQIDG